MTLPRLWLRRLQKVRVLSESAIAVANWEEQNGVELEFTQPGRPMQIGFIERFNRTYREAVLDMNIFESLSDVRSHTERLLEIYNHHRTHDSHGGTPLCEYLTKHNTGNVFS